MNCPECERFRVLLRVVTDAARRETLMFQRSEHERVCTHAGLAAQLWRGHSVIVSTPSTILRPPERGQQ